MKAVAIALIGSVVCVTNVFAAELPDDLAEVVTNQRKNRVEMVANLTKSAIQLKQSGDHDRAKAVKKLADDVKANRVINFSSVGAYVPVGRLSHGVVTEVAQDHYVVRAEIDEVTGEEETRQIFVPGPGGGVGRVATGRMVTLSQKRNVKFYTGQKLDVNDNVSSIPCRLKKTGDGYVAVALSQDELDAALAALKTRDLRSL